MQRVAKALHRVYHRLVTNPHTLAVETDTALSDLYVEQYRLTARLGAIISDLHRHAGHHHQFVSRNRGVWVKARNDMTRVGAFEAVTGAQAKVANPNTMPWETTSATSSLAAHAEVLQAIDANQANITELNKVWAENGRWSRFFLVTSSAGHIHSSMDCSTCRATTEFAWLPTVSGLTEVEAVAEHGPTLCSVCFPSAPVGWTLTVGQAKKLAKAQG